MKIRSYDPEFARRHLELNSRLAIPEAQTAGAIAAEHGKEREWSEAYQQWDPGDRPYRRSGKSLFDLLTEVCTKRRLTPYNRDPQVYSVDEKFLAVEDIQCVDADGNVFEQYPLLYLAKDVVRNNGSQVNFRPYQAVVHFEKENMFVPSSALTCNIAAVLYLHRDNPDADKVLLQYKDRGDGYGLHAQNTVADYNRQKIIHYPGDADFPAHGGTANINASLSRTELAFEKVRKNGVFKKNNRLHDTALKDGLQDPAVLHFVKQFTGLADPSILVEIGQYFQKPAWVWFPTNPIKVKDCTETRAAWFGCDSNDLYLSGNFILFSSIAVRGVRLELPEGRALKTDELDSK